MNLKLKSWSTTYWIFDKRHNTDDIGWNYTDRAWINKQYTLLGDPSLIPKGIPHQNMRQSRPPKNFCTHRSKWRKMYTNQHKLCFVQVKIHENVGFEHAVTKIWTYRLDKLEHWYTSAKPPHPKPNPSPFHTCLSWWPVWHGTAPVNPPPSFIPIPSHTVAHCLLSCLCKQRCIDICIWQVFCAAEVHGSLAILPSSPASSAH